MQKSGSSSNDSHGNCVILVCINNKSGKVLTHDKFFKLFSPFGTIQRILIFERGAIWKTFVEFDNSESAYRARVNLNGLNFGDEQMKMNVYASQLERIQFQENNSGGVDYTQLRQRTENRTSANNTPSIQQSFLKLTKSPAQTPNSIQQKSPFSQYSTTPIQQPDYFSTQQMFFNQQSLNLQFMQQQLFLQQQMQSLVQRLNQLMFMLQQINNGQQIQSQLNYTQLIDQSQQIYSIDKQQSLIKEINDVQKQSLILTEQYKLLLQNFQQVQGQSLYNNFGGSPKPYYQSPAGASASSKFNGQNQSSPYKSNVNGIQNLRKMSDSQIPIQFVTTVQDADIQNSPKQTSELDHSNNKQEGKCFTDSCDELISSRSEDDNDNEEHAQMCKVFQNDDQLQISDKDARDLYNKTLNIPENNQEEGSKQQILSMLENHIQQNANDKVSLNIKQIDELINKSKNKNEIVNPLNELIQQTYFNKIPIDPIQQENILQIQQQMMTQQMYEEVENYQDPNEYVNPLFLKVVRKSKVIYARWFDKKNVTLRMLYNIFSTYGNIEKMIFLKEKSSVLIQYQNIEYASYAKEALNDVIYFNQSIKIFFSNYEEIYLKDNNLTKGEFKEDPNSNEEYFQGCSETNRFQPGCTYAFTSPSDSLQLSNLSKQSCSEGIIQSIFDFYGKIQKMKFIAHPNDKNVCILKYETVQQSLITLSHLHGVDINGKNINIQFTKLKL